MAEEIPPEYITLIKTLQQMKLEPKADDPAQFQQWVSDFAQGGARVKVREEPGASKPTYVTPPRISVFSGSSDKKGETTYQLWRFEVQCLMQDKTHSPDVVAHAVRRSLKGEAGLVAMRLGPGSSLSTLLTKMESVFGDVGEKESIMSEFYNAKQEDSEDVTSWSCRLEGILDKAIYMGKVSVDQVDNMLHDMLWKGLKPALKDVSHYEKERHATFDTLRVALRKLEKEYESDRAPTKSLKGTVKQAVATESEESEFTAVLKQIYGRLDNLEKQQGQQQYPQQQQQNTPQQSRGRGSYRGYERGYDRGYGRNYNRGYSRGNSRGYGRGRGFDRQQSNESSNVNFNFPPLKCNRCGQEGHIARGCRNNKDINGKPLN